MDEPDPNYNPGALNIHNHDEPSMHSTQATREQVISSHNHSENDEGEGFDEGSIQHPYENLVMKSSEPKQPQFDDSEPLQHTQPTKAKPMANSFVAVPKDKPSPKTIPKQSFDAFDQPRNIHATHQVEPKRSYKASHTQKVPVSHEKIGQRPDSRDANDSRQVKSAHRTNSDNTRQHGKNIIQNSGISENAKRASSNKERKTKASPIRTTKASSKEMSMTQYFTGKSKGAQGHKKVKGVGQAFKGSKYSHANVVKGSNLSLNNFKTEIRLPNAQKFLNETQFVKSPFLSKTLKGMMQPKPAKASNPHSSNYGRLGATFQTTAGRRKREASAHSNKSKRETSGSHKKGGKGHKLMNTKK